MMLIVMYQEIIISTLNSAPEWSGKFFTDCPTFKRTKERKQGKPISNAKRSLKLCHTHKNKTTTTSKEAYKQNNQTKQKHEKTSRSETGRKKANKTRLTHGSYSFIYPQSIKIVNQSAILPDTPAISCSVDVFPSVVTIFVAVIGPGGFVLLGKGWRKQTPRQLSVIGTWKLTLFLGRHLWSGNLIRRKCSVSQAFP